MHLNFADHLAWGYFSVPPFIGGVAYCLKLLGNDPFWVHLFPALVFISQSTKDYLTIDSAEIIVAKGTSGKMLQNIPYRRISLICLGGKD